MVGIDLPLSSKANRHFVEIAEAVAGSLCEVGCDARVLIDELPPGEDGRVPVVIGPHELFPRLPDLSVAAVDDTLRRGICICSEQPSTPWFGVALQYASRAAMVLDISDVGVAALRRQGVSAGRFQLGYHASFDSWHGVAAERPVDLAFLGSSSDHRLRLLASLAEVLDGWRSELRITDVDDDQRDPASGFIGATAKRELLSRTRILLDVQRGDDRYFTWARALDALCNGCLLLAEEGAGFSPLVPGRHFVSASTASLPILLEALLRDPASVEAIAVEAYDFLREHVPMTLAAERLADAAEKLDRMTPAGRGGGHVRSAPASVQSEVAPAPTEAMGATPTSEALGALATADRRQGVILKRVALELISLRRTVSTLVHEREHPQAPAYIVRRTPAAEAASPEVTVVIPLYNYRRHVGAAIASALASADVAVEVVVVDDASTDGSAEEVMRLIERRADAPLTLVQQAVNHGLAVSRNLGFDHARAPLVFLLDADNLVLPHGIAKLRAALAADARAAFAYGLIQRFDTSGPTTLMGTSPWDPRRLRRGNYIDAMALVRSSAWEEVGGYATEPALYGWEDFDFWLGCAEAGLHGLDVPQIVARYRVHDASMIAITNLETESVFATLRARHPRVFAERTS